MRGDAHVDDGATERGAHGARGDAREIFGVVRGGADGDARARGRHHARGVHAHEQEGFEPVCRARGRGTDEE